MQSVNGIVAVIVGRVRQLPVWMMRGSITAWGNEYTSW
jgi:hypothetical protein